MKLSDFGFIKRAVNNTSKVKDLKNILGRYTEETKEDDYKLHSLPMIGSERYTPPEVIKTQKAIPNPAYDIWTLG